MNSTTTAIHRAVKVAACSTWLLLSTTVAPAQGSFQNLGFESATITPGGIGNVPFSSAFPGWTGYVGGSQVSLAAQNYLWLDGSGISILDNSFSNPYGGPPGTIEGNFTAAFSAGMIEGVTNAADVTLSQTGLIPATRNLCGSKQYGRVIPRPVLWLCPLAGKLSFSFPWEAGRTTPCMQQIFVPWRAKLRSLTSRCSRSVRMLLIISCSWTPSSSPTLLFQSQAS